MRYVDPDGNFVQVITGAILGAVTGAITNAMVQTLSNLVSGQDLKSSIFNIDYKTLGAAAIGGAVTGAVSGGLSSIKTVGEAVTVYKSAKTAMNVVSNVSGATLSTVADNYIHGNKLTDNIVENAGVAAIAGTIIGISSKTGMQATYTNEEGLKQSVIYYSKKLAQSNLSVLSTIPPNETVKEFSVGVLQEMTPKILQSGEEK